MKVGTAMGIGSITPGPITIRGGSCAKTGVAIRVPTPRASASSVRKVVLMGLIIGLMLRSFVSCLPACPARGKGKKPHPVPR
jgi:hypothetical protein